MRYIILSFLVSSYISIQAQTFQANYKQTINLSSSITSDAELIFNSTEWIYSIIENKQKATNHYKSDEYVNLVKDKTQFFYRSSTDRIYVDTEYLLNGSKTIVSDSLIMPTWEIINDSSKVIKGYTCIKAKTIFCGRCYNAWFTPEIQTNCGPWKLWGLPGLIIEAQSTDGIFDVSLNSIILIKNIQIKQKLHIDMNYISYKKKMKSDFEKLSRYLRSEINEDRNIETEIKTKAVFLDNTILE